MRQLPGHLLNRVVALSFLVASGVVAMAGAPFPVEILEEQARLENALPLDFNTYAERVAVSGDRAVASEGNRADLFAREADGWRYRGSFHGVFRAVALDGETLVLARSGHAALNTPDAVDVYVPADGPGLNAWTILDRSGSTPPVHYRVDVSPETHEEARQSGWRFRWTARMLDEYQSGSPSMVFLYGNGTRRYGIWLRVNTEGNLVALLMGVSPEARVLTSNRNLATRYHDHELVFDPDTQMVTYFFNGVSIHSWTGEAQSNNGIQWGCGSTAGTGAMNVHQVRFELFGDGPLLAAYDAGTENNPSIAPDPVSQGWNLAGTPGINTPVGPQSPDPMTAWQRRATLTDSGETRVQAFGHAIALDGDILVVGASHDDEDGTDTGSAYVFVRDGSTWSLDRKLAPSVRANGDHFGRAVDVDGDTLVIGAPHESSAAANTFRGRAFVFVRANGVWSEQAMLTGLDTTTRASFGRAVAVDGDQVVVGAPWNGNFAGAAYVFDRTGATWLESAKLTGNSGEFGSSVDLKEGVMIVAASSESAHWIFAQSSAGPWELVERRAYEHSFNPGIGGVSFDGRSFMVGVFEFSGSVGYVYLYGTDYSNASGLEAYVRKHLYHPDATSATHPVDPNRAAFRYRHLLYGEENGSVRARLETLADLYGRAERDLAVAMEEELLKGLALNPDHDVLGNLLLDIFYDRTVAESLFVRDVEERAERARFGVPPSGGFIIDGEIPLRSQVLESNRFALQGYFHLLSSDFGLPIDPPLGFRLFLDLVPGRGLMAATHTNETGGHVPVTDDPMLFSGYKDLVLLFELLRDHGRAAETLARLLISRGTPADLERATEVIAGAQRFVYLQGNLLMNLFSEWPPEDDPSGLAKAVDGWRQSLNALATLAPLLSGGDNVLGFAEEFMMYVQKFSGQAEHFDSFDALKVRLDPDASGNPLGFALEEFQVTLDSYGAYRGFEDQLAAQFDHSSITYADRLRDIAGVFPGDPRYSDNPTSVPGSELDLQYRSVELARLQIKRNQVEIQNLNEQIQIELNKATSISNVIVRFGQRQAELTKVIGHYNAAQAGANALADALSPEKILTGRLVGYLVNAGVQAGAEEMKAQKEAEKEELAALEQATITGIESEATVKTLVLGLKVLAVDSQEAATLLRQEMNRLIALYREKEDLEQKIAEADASLARRYFADPIHRLTAQADMVDANLAFDEARRWLFFLARALEYKWNTPFRNFEYPAGSGRRWSTSTLFKLRNAEELRQMFLAMDGFESQIQLPKDDYFDWFSVREAFFGYELTDRAGAPRFYADPMTGENVGAVQAFRSRLRQLQDESGNIRLRFSTVREIPGGSFFRGPRFSASGQPQDKGLFLDKIRWIKINLPGAHTLGRTQLSGNLTYGGTSFIRNFDVGVPDPQRPDRLRDELTAFTTRFWFFHAPSGSWRFNEALSSPVNMQLDLDPRTPPTVQEIDIFKERSVATSGWVLVIPTRDQGQDVLNIDELDDVELYFYHYAVSRQ
jgi:hypothetical protein